MNRPVFACLLLFVSFGPGARADERPLLHPLFTDHMVLQRDRQNRIWGWDEPGTTISIEFHGKTNSATVEKDGKWQALLEPLAAGGPHTLTVRGTKEIIIKDVLVGDVWLCSGQSNMQWTVGASRDAAQEIAAAKHARIRLFSVPRKMAEEPQELLAAEWQECSPDTIGSFSAVGYYFGRSLHQELDVPVGLIHSSWGGTVAEAWVSAPALQRLPDFRDALQAAPERIRQQNDPRNKPVTVAEWWKSRGSPRLQGTWRTPQFEDTDWKTMELPKKWEQAVPELADFDGVVRFRRTFQVPEGVGSDGASLSLGKIDDIDTTWVNGKRVGSTSGWDSDRVYKIPRDLLQAGENVVAVRVFDSGQGGGFHGAQEAMSIHTTSEETIISLAGEWKYESGRTAKELGIYPSGRNRRWPDPNIVTALYNAMISPLLPYEIRGAIWYQGESNAGRPQQYRPLLETLIGDWRNRFQNPQLPFFIVQLANFKQVQTQPVESGWAELRESQQRVAQADPLVGLAVITDIGEADDIHPRNKQDVGKRLALSALKIAYGRQLVDSGPTYAKHSVEGGLLRVDFENVGDGLAADGDLKGFAIAGADGKFVWAEARIEGASVVLSSPEVEAPVHARYNWANNPIGNLYNSANLPAAPFRTDVP